MAEYIAARGVTVVNVNYRLSTDSLPSVRHPDHINDVYAALTYLVDNADVLGINPRITLVGHSVGAWMVLGALTQHKDEMPELDERILSHITAAVAVVCNLLTRMVFMTLSRCWRSIPHTQALSSLRLIATTTGHFRVARGSCGARSLFTSSIHPMTNC